MAEPSGILTPQQRACLESVYMLLRTARLYLDGLCSKLEVLDRLQLQSIVRLLLLNESRLVEHFAEIKAFEEEWERRGGAR